MHSPARRRALALLIVAAVAGSMGRGQARAGPSTGDPALGKPIYVKNCVPCHKIDGSGGFKLTGNPTPNWRDPKRMSDPKYGDDYLRDCITNGKTKSGMVPWKAQIKPADIENLIAYIRTFAKK
jgi:mono/diheme cytochrome c family protein